MAVGDELTIPLIQLALDSIDIDGKKFGPCAASQNQDYMYIRKVNWNRMYVHVGKPEIISPPWPTALDLSRWYQIL